MNKFLGIFLASLLLGGAAFADEHNKEAVEKPHATAHEAEAGKDVDVSKEHDAHHEHDGHTHDQTHDHDDHKHVVAE